MSHKALILDEYILDKPRFPIMSNQEKQQVISCTRDELVRAVMVEVKDYLEWTELESLSESAGLLIGNRTFERVCLQ